VAVKHLVFIQRKLSSVMDITIPFGTNTVIHSGTDLFVLCSRQEFSENTPTDLVLKRVDNRFYRSASLYRNTMVFDEDENPKEYKAVSQFWFEPNDLPKNITVLMLRRDCADSLVFRVIEGFPHLLRYLKFAERELCNLTLLEGDVAFDGPFVNLERRSITQWKKNKIVLTSLFHRAFRSMHFDIGGDAAVVAAAAGYDAIDVVKSSKTKKYFRKVRFSPIEKEKYEDLMTQDQFDWMVKYLIDLGLNEMVKTIMKATLLSIDYCQLALHNQFLKNIVHTFPEVATGIIYAMRILHLEEKAKYIKATWDERFLFNIEQVQGLPRFRRFNWDNPYLLTTGYRHRTGQQLMIPALWKGKRGVYDTDEAIERLETYTGGIFANLEWTHKETGVRTALCGSAIPAIFVKNPLEEGMGSMEDYFQEYYPAVQRGVVGSQEDRNVENTGSVYVVEVSEEDDEHFDVESSSESSDSDAADADSDDNIPAPAPVHGRRRRTRRRPRGRANDDAVRSQMADEDADDEDEVPDEATPLELFYDRFTDIDLMIETDDLDLFDQVCESHLDAIRSTLPEDMREKVYMKMFMTENKYRYKIYGLPRSIELFCVNSVPGVIVKFHLACVRAWWDGEQFHMFPSFVTAAMTGVCHELRWTSCNKDLRDIVLKYYQRGFAIMLNKREIANLIEFVNASSRWPAFPPVPPGNGGYYNWDAKRWAMKPFYLDVQTDFWNPSISHFGVYYKLKGVSRKGLTRPEWTRDHNGYSGMSWRIPKSRSKHSYKILAPDKINWTIMDRIYTDQ
jgi:hypothetical protein